LGEGAVSGVHQGKKKEKKKIKTGWVGGGGGLVSGS